MHPEVALFVKWVKSQHPAYFHEADVLEVGSLNINGSVRDFFVDCHYIGLDLGAGKDVDLVCPIHVYLNRKGAETVISTEMLEHDRHWEHSLQSMYENLRPRGLMILTCAGPTRNEHGTARTTPGDAPFTTDYYRNISHEDFRRALPEEGFKTYELSYNAIQSDLYFYGIKK